MRDCQAKDSAISGGNGRAGNSDPARAAHIADARPAASHASGDPDPNVVGFDYPTAASGRWRDGRYPSPTDPSLDGDHSIAAGAAPDIAAAGSADIADAEDRGYAGRNRRSGFRHGSCLRQVDRTRRHLDYRHTPGWQDPSPVAQPSFECPSRTSSSRLVKTLTASGYMTTERQRPAFLADGR